MSEHNLKEIVVYRDGTLYFLVQCERCRGEITVAWKNGGELSMSLNDIEATWERSEDKTLWAHDALKKGPSCDEMFVKKLLDA